MAGAAVFAVVALSFALSATAQTAQDPDAPAAKAADRAIVEIRAPIGARPEFYVPWGPNPPGLSAKPQLKRGGQPTYPEASVKAREAGFTTLELCITVEGRPTDIRLVSSSGFPRLDEALMTWIPTARYSPAKFHGSPMAVCGYQLTFEWRLDG
jgi:TonB family protein